MSEMNEYQEKNQVNQLNAAGSQSIWDNAPQPQLSVVGSVNGASAQTQPPKPDTEETKRLRENFGFFGPVTFLYAVFYTFCMYRNGSGVTFPFFVAGSLLYLHFSLSKLGTTLKRGSGFYMAAMLLLGISTFCTDDGRLIFFNKLGIFLLMMSLLLRQFFDTSRWNLGKYLLSICRLVFASFGELGRPVSDGILYRKGRSTGISKKVWYAVAGLVVAVPVLLVALALLSSADAVFRQMMGDWFKNIRLGNGMNVTLRIIAVYFAAYALTAYLCKHGIKEDVTDRRKGEPVLAITVTGLLTLLYLLFSVVQIGGFFLGKMQLPQGYTYAMYAREGFFQLLAVSLFNLVIVLVCMSYFKESRVLKGVLTIMSLCTFVMIASSALRMVIYIRFYYLTFLRILVLWSLTVLSILFVGILVSIFKENFPLFRYSMTVVTVLYLILSFAHPDYIIARVNVANAPHQGMNWWSEEEARQAAQDFSQADMFGGRFFLSMQPYHDYSYLAGLSADAAPVLIPYLEELGYDEGFGYYWIQRMQERTQNLGIRTFNVSRYIAKTLSMQNAAERAYMYHIMEPEYTSSQEIMMDEETQIQQVEATKTTEGWVVDRADGLMYFFLDEQKGWRLAVVDAALGSRLYRLEKTEDGGDSWDIINKDPFDGSGGVAEGLIFYDEDFGCAGLAGASQSYSQLYITYDGGLNFKKVMLPLDTVTELPELGQSLGFTPADYDYFKMPEQAGAELFIMAITQEGENSGLLFKSEDCGITWTFCP